MNDTPGNFRSPSASITCNSQTVAPSADLIAAATRQRGNCQREKTTVYAFTYNTQVGATVHTDTCKRDSLMNCPIG